MKLIHMGDLHIGKRVHEVNMLKEQEFALKQVLALIEEEKPDAVLLAGDIYDKAVPSAEAVELVDEFLTQLSERGQKVFMISGNHDSPERLSFGSRILRKKNLFISEVFQGTMNRYSLEDEFGEVVFYLLPFIKPANVRAFEPEKELETYEAAVRTVIEKAEIDTRKRNVLIAHQFVTAAGAEAERSESEAVSVGGQEQIDVSVFAPFDYVALGHLHAPQRMGRESVRYAGSLLKYSFSEAQQKKSITVVTIAEKGNMKIEKKPVAVLHDMRKVRGTLKELLDPAVYEGTAADDYLQITLTDTEPVLDAVGKLRSVYKNMLRLEFEYKKENRGRHLSMAEVEQKSSLALFEEFYRDRNGIELSKRQRMEVKRIFEELEEGI